MTRAWTEAETADLCALYPTTDNRKLVQILNDKHGNGRSVSSIQQHARKAGIYKAEGHKHPMPRTFWTDDRRDWFIGFVPGHHEHEISAEHERVFGTPLSKHQIKGAKLTFGVKSGTTGGRFEKGLTPANKGKTWDEYMPPESQERCRQTCFKTGGIPHNGMIKPIGTERIDSKDGYTWVKVADRPSRQDCNDNWRMKHHMAWEEAHGTPVPDDMRVVFANHDKSDFRPENLVAVPKKVWAIIMRNGYQYNDAKSLEACVKLAMLKSSIHEAECSAIPCKMCGVVFRRRYPNQRRCDTCLGR